MSKKEIKVYLERVDKTYPCADDESLRDIGFKISVLAVRWKQDPGQVAEKLLADICRLPASQANTEIYMKSAKALLKFKKSVLTTA